MLLEAINTDDFGGGGVIAHHRKVHEKSLNGVCQWRREDNIYLT